MHPKTFFGMAGGAIATLVAYLLPVIAPHAPPLNAAEIAAITTVCSAFGSSFGADTAPPKPDNPPAK